MLFSFPLTYVLCSCFCWLISASSWPCSVDLGYWPWFASDYPLVQTLACYWTSFCLLPWYSPQPATWPHFCLTVYYLTTSLFLAVTCYQATRTRVFFFVELCTSVTTFRGAWTRATREVLSSARPPTKVCKTSNLDRQEVDKVEGQMCTIYERYMEIAVESFVHRCLKIEPSVRN